VEGAVEVRGDLVLPRHEIDLLVAIEGGGNPVAGTVDVDDLAGVPGNAVGR